LASGVLSTATIVDRLPSRLWGSGNLVILPGGDLHFCVASTGSDSSTRTVEWNGREIARGRQPVTHSHLAGEGAVIQVPARRVVAVAVAASLIVAAAMWSRSNRHA
jgi:hypothetical protein